MVVTGLGVVAPNANGLPEFELALRKGRSGIRRNAVRPSLPPMRASVTSEPVISTSGSPS